MLYVVRPCFGYIFPARETKDGGANALIIGKPGTGKSHVAKAVAYRATLHGYDVRYVEADQNCCKCLILLVGPRGVEPRTNGL